MSIVLGRSSMERRIAASTSLEFEALSGGPQILCCPTHLRKDLLLAEQSSDGAAAAEARAAALAAIVASATGAAAVSTGDRKAATRHISEYHKHEQRTSRQQSLRDQLQHSGHRISSRASPNWWAKCSPLHHKQQQEHQEELLEQVEKPEEQVEKLQEQLEELEEAEELHQKQQQQRMHLRRRWTPRRLDSSMGEEEEQQQPKAKPEESRKQQEVPASVLWASQELRTVVGESADEALWLPAAAAVPSGCRSGCRRFRNKSGFKGMHAGAKSGHARMASLLWNEAYTRSSQAAGESCLERVLVKACSCSCEESQVQSRRARPQPGLPIAAGVSAAVALSEKSVGSCLVIGCSRNGIQQQRLTCAAAAEALLQAGGRLVSAPLSAEGALRQQLSAARGWSSRPPLLHQTFLTQPVASDSGADTGAAEDAPAAGYAPASPLLFMCCIGRNDTGDGVLCSSSSLPAASPLLLSIDAANTCCLFSLSGRLELQPKLRRCLRLTPLMSRQLQCLVRRTNLFIGVGGAP
ncbi:hypothetical protein cyc_05503 [Cyclospora cayetanensis]|uniref:Uncharacterized protein n=1 Tax=Cyclospora cayetanensis TaxID=88456 RepID=A0A1D3D7S0_9EIME|nr:hypothetical protein cyc_05503 [Cyclospora cayetanensis]